MDMRKRYWMGYVPTQDDFGQPLGDEFIDGKTKMGPWALMTPARWRTHGVGLGTGKGQWYRKQPDGKWLKIEG
jgi:hypothetical protein